MTYVLGASSAATQTTAQLSAELALPISISRVYMTGVPAALPAGLAPAPGVVVVSGKPDLAQQASGSLDAAWEHFYDFLTRPVVVTIWHEPDSKIRGGTFTYAAWQAAFSHWVSHAHSYRAAHGAPITTMLNLTNGPWRWAPEDASRYVTPGQTDLFAVDAYQDVASDWLTPEGLLGPVLEWALQKGYRRLGVPEFGAIADSRRAQWVTDMAAWLDSWDTVEWANYWTDAGSQFDVRTDPAAKSALRKAILRRQLG